MGKHLNLCLCVQSHIQSTSDRIQFNDLQSLLCATLQVRRLARSAVAALQAASRLHTVFCFHRTSCERFSIRTPCRSLTW